MFILIDYSNIPDKYQGKDKEITDFIDILFLKIKKYIPDDDNLLRFRLYGGWYNEDSLSKDAEILQKMIFKRNNPFIKRRGKGLHFLKIYTTLALSLISNESKNLFFTYREKKFPRNIKCYDPDNALCDNPNCDALTLLRFFTKKYKTPCCHRGIKELLFRGEQKLVDSMIVSDAVFLALHKDVSPVVIVSSDDDIWPAIETIVACKKQVLHLHTISHEGVDYQCGIDEKYYIPLSI